MKRCFKEILKYIIIFFMVLILLFLLLVSSSKIPKNLIEENIEESVQFFKKNAGFKQIRKNRDYTFLHLYADGVLLNIIYNMDSNNALEASLWDKFYKEVNADINNDFIKTVEEKTGPNEQYLRYWHGSMTILRPLLILFNIEQIYLLNQIILWLLAIVLLVLIFKKSKKLAAIYIIGMLMIVFPIVPLCLEYSWTFYIMLITSIIAILIEKKGNKNLYSIFLVSGMITCFLDFLTTEIITIFVPLLLVLFIRKEEDKLEGFNKTLFFVIKSCILWALGYFMMWLAKWIIASLILNINAMDYVKNNALLRINGKKGLIPINIIYKNVIFENWHNLYPINHVKRESDLCKIIIIFLLVIVFSFDWKHIKRKWFSGILLLIAIMPYVRYLILASHSYTHNFFTFRNQIITVMATCMIVLDCLNYKLLFKKVNMKGKNKIC